jgi:hypothetical protein
MLQIAKKLMIRAKRKAVYVVKSLTMRKIPLPKRIAQKKIIFIGASVGQSWNLPLVFPNIKTMAVYQFDKTSAIQQAIAEKPDVIILKECAAYFPSPQVQRDLVRNWIVEIRHHGVIPALATVVPVTHQHAQRVPGRIESIWKFNDWLREYAKEKKIALLDLEKALSISASDRHLAPRLDSGDGLHLNREAYRDVLDYLIPPFLVELFP